MIRLLFRKCTEFTEIRSSGLCSECPGRASKTEGLEVVALPTRMRAWESKGQSQHREMGLLSCFQTTDEFIKASVMITEVKVPRAKASADAYPDLGHKLSM